MNQTEKIKLSFINHCAADINKYWKYQDEFSLSSSDVHLVFTAIGLWLPKLTLFSAVMCRFEFVHQG